ncbi:MAG: PadR family transcriptional regulator [Syntrophomonadaceae bacterium]
MNIKFAILGFLSWKPFSGYDLKKIFVQSQSLYWSGNNNQIYRSLVQLHQEGLVESEIQLQENNPARKLYTITALGRSALEEWLKGPPEPLQLRNTFLIQLSWADQLDDNELDNLLSAYEEELELQLLIHTEREKRGSPNPARTDREKYLWQMISLNWSAVYQNELSWVRQLRSGLNRVRADLS